jgi:hypothetical protein
MDDDDRRVSHALAMYIERYARALIKQLDDRDRAVDQLLALAEREAKQTRKPSLIRAVKQARKLNKTVSGATMATDGSVTLTFGEPAPAQQNVLDNWLAKRNAH